MQIGFAELTFALCLLTHNPFQTLAMTLITYVKPVKCIYQLNTDLFTEVGNGIRLPEYIQYIILQNLGIRVYFCNKMVISFNGKYRYAIQLAYL
jgi:hypothetical protein